MRGRAITSTGGKARKQSTDNTFVPNRILEALPRADRNRIIAASERVALRQGDSLYESGEQMHFVYFPLGCFVSLIASTDGTNHVEVALVGAEGMLGIPSMLHIPLAPFKAVVQGAGLALRMDTAEFVRQLKERPALAKRLSRYLYVQVVDLGWMVTCTRFHLVEQRLARWLLMTRDRAGAQSFHLTQNVMALMLGVRRAGVTQAAGSLQTRGLISYRRGNITIRDNRGLERMACSCYARSRQSYAHHLGPWNGPLSIRSDSQRGLE